jgi:NADH:ubiquinone oxidoreductase subunit 3 (subunit A)
MKAVVPLAIVAAVILLACPAAIAAQQPKKPDKVKVNPCAQYGAGFVAVEGTKTCIKTSAGFTIEGGFRR